MQQNKSGDQKHNSPTEARTDPETKTPFHRTPAQYTIEQARAYLRAVEYKITATIYTADILAATPADVPDDVIAYVRTDDEFGRLIFENATLPTLAGDWRVV